MTRLFGDERSLIDIRFIFLSIGAIGTNFILPWALPSWKIAHTVVNFALHVNTPPLVVKSSCHQTDILVTVWLVHNFIEESIVHVEHLDSFLSVQF